jgi:hypothetical protein
MYIVEKLLSLIILQYGSYMHFCACLLSLFTDVCHVDEWLDGAQVTGSADCEYQVQFTFSALYQLPKNILVLLCPHTCLLDTVMI